MIRSFFILLLLTTPQFVFAQVSDAISFTPEGKDVAQPYFKEGLMLLHVFEYEEAAEKFKTAQLMDPDFVMAYWGEAMSYYQPLWNKLEVKKGRAALLKLGLFPEDRIAMAKNALEKGFIGSVEKLYEEGIPEPARIEAYNAVLKTMKDQFPDHPEVLSFYALSVLDNSCGEAEKLDIAAESCQKALAENPNHPGALHYLIQSYDTPGRADQGLKVADKFFAVAPEYEHALHIPSHIYAGLGLWDKMAVANKKSWEVAEARVKKEKLSLEDRGYHSLWWLQYASLQKGQYSKSAEWAKEMYQDARLSKSKKTRFHALVLRTNYLIESEDWNNTVSNYDIPAAEIHILVKANDLLAKGLKAYHTSDNRKLEWITGQLEDLRIMEKSSVGANQSCIYEPLINRNTNEQDLELIEAMELELRALLALTINDTEKAITHIKKAVEIESSVPHVNGPPLIFKPANELYGEILLKLNKTQEAVVQFDNALEKHPNRSRSLVGKYKALNAAGNSAEAATVKKQILSNWKDADPGLAAGIL